MPVLRSRTMRLLGVAATAAVLACKPDSTSPPTALGLDDGFALSSPEAEGMDTIALQSLIDSAAAQHSEALVIIRHGKLVYKNYFGSKDEQIAMMSMTKSMVSLAIGFLIDDGKLSSIDVPVTTVLPEFARSDPRKASITIRHLLTNTSGIDPTRAIVRGTDIESWANESRCVWQPGSSFQYSNNGFDILGLVAQKIAGKRLDNYLYEKLLLPLDIPARAGSWAYDSRIVPMGAGEMSLRPMEVARIGQMILDGGVWNGKHVISKAWLDQSFKQASSFRLDYGRGWWLPINGPYTYAVTPDIVVQWVGNGLPQSAADRLAPIVGKDFQSPTELTSAIAGLLTADEAAALTTIQTTGDHIDRYRLTSATGGRSYYASGWLGQYLDIVFERGVVAVRMRRSRPSDYTSRAEVDGFPAFLSMVLKASP